MLEDDDLVIDEDVIDNTEEEEIVETSDNLEEESESDPESIQDEEDDDEEDRIVTIGDEEVKDPEGEEAEEHQEAPNWVKKVRKKNRELEKEKKRLERQLEELSKSTEKEEPVELGEEPTLAKCNYDEAKFKAETRAYDERKRKVDEQNASKAKQVEQQRKIIQDRETRYKELKEEHKFKDFEETEETVATTFSLDQQNVLVRGAEDSALLVYALGKNPKILEELSKTTDLVEFSFKLAKVEAKLKVRSRKAPAPEKRIKSGKSGSSGSSDKVLARLEAEADKTGDRTKVSAYRRQLRDKG